MKNIFLHENWQLRWFEPEEQVPSESMFNLNTGQQGWIAADVPGDVYTSMMKAGQIEDPYVSTNDNQSRWMEEKTWCYRTVFDFPEERIGKKFILRFEGLDTLAALFLNGSNQPDFHRIAEGEQISP